MGCVSSKAATEEEVRANKKIDAILRKEKKEAQFIIKLLLLGAGESGKSTFAKQMKILFLEGYTNAELCLYKDIVYSNIIVGMRSILHEVEKRELSLDAEVKDHVELLLSEALLLDPIINPEIRVALEHLWKQPSVAAVYEKRNEFQLADSVGFFCDHIQRIGRDEYVPTVEDVLQSRTRTIGVKEMSFKSEGHTWKLVDVGGQRNERKKWIHCFEEVTAIIFFADSSAYNLTLFEDNRVNRLLEALTLFEEICNCKYFHTTPLILFLNKRDLLKLKIQTVDIADYFDDYEGGHDFTKATEWLTTKFTALVENPEKKVFTHLTCATDTNNITHTFDAVANIILLNTLKNNVLL